MQYAKKLTSSQVRRKKVIYKPCHRRFGELANETEYNRVLTSAAIYLNPFNRLHKYLNTVGN